MLLITSNCYKQLNLQLCFPHGENKINKDQHLNYAYKVNICKDMFTFFKSSNH